MARSRERDLGQPEIGLALAWLRARSYLTQKEVVEGAASAGETISDVYYQMIETGKRKPSAPKLSALVQALGSDREELEGLVAARVWEGAPRGGYRFSRRPRPEVYGRAAMEALADVNGSGQWSSPVEATGQNAAFGLADSRPPDSSDASILRSAEPRTTLERNERMTFTPAKDRERGGTYDIKLQGELAELSDHFLRLPPKERQRLLEAARTARRG